MNEMGQSKWAVFVVSRDWQVARNVSIIEKLNIVKNQVLFISEENWVTGNATKTAEALGYPVWKIPGPYDWQINIFNEIQGLKTVRDTIEKSTSEFRAILRNFIGKNAFVLFYDGLGPYLHTPLNEIYYGAFRELAPLKIIFMQHGEFSRSWQNLWQAVLNRMKTIVFKVRHKVIEYKWNYEVWLFNEEYRIFSIVQGSKRRNCKVVGNFNLLKYEEDIGNKTGFDASDKDRQKNQVSLVIYSPGVLRWSQYSKLSNEFILAVRKLVDLAPNGTNVYIKLKPGENKGDLSLDLGNVGKSVDFLDPMDDMKKKHSFHALNFCPVGSNTSIDLLAAGEDVILYVWTKDRRFRNITSDLLAENSPPIINLINVKFQDGKSIIDPVNQDMIQSHVRELFEIKLRQQISECKTKLAKYWETHL